MSIVQTREEPIKQLCEAMAKAFVEIGGAVTDKTNPHFKSKYASLGNVIDAIKPVITKYGLWFYQVIHQVTGCAAVETVIIHSSGEKISCGVMSVPISKNDAQGYGSGLTYARRYSLSSAFGVAPEDDDGEEACKPTKKPIQVNKVEIPAELVEEELFYLDNVQIYELAEEMASKTELNPSDLLVYLRAAEKKCIAEMKKPFGPVYNFWMNNPPKLVESYQRWLEKAKVA
jgi:hypothetical protein